MSGKFPSDYKKEVLGTTVFVNEQGELDTVGRDDILMQDRRTGRYHKQNINELVSMIKLVFPTKEEQRDIVKSMIMD